MTDDEFLYGRPGLDHGGLLDRSGVLKQTLPPSVMKRRRADERREAKAPPVRKFEAVGARDRPRPPYALKAISERKVGGTPKG